MKGFLRQKALKSRLIGQIKHASVILNKSKIYVRLYIRTQILKSRGVLRRAIRQLSNKNSIFAKKTKEGA